MLIPITLIVVSIVVMVVGVRWAKTDEDDILRKVITSCVQLMCVGTLLFGIFLLFNRPTKPATEETPVATPTARATVPNRPPVNPPAASTVPIQPDPAAQAQEAERLRQDQERQRMIAQPPDQSAGGPPVQNSTPPPDPQPGNPAPQDPGNPPPANSGTPPENAPPPATNP